MEDFAGLPAPVARYLRHVLPVGQPLIRRLYQRQRGELRTSGQSRRWLDFEAEQVTNPLTTSFVWDARVQILPLISLSVRDAYADGRASSHIKLLSTIRVGSDSDRPELNSGALHRYLAEAVWYPTALLPTEALRWAAIDDFRAHATLSDGGQSVSLEFRFNAAGEISGVYTPGRWEKFGRGYRQTPWEGHFHSYELKANMLVPSRGEVGWYQNGNWQKVWSGSVLESSYELLQ
ncbi:MAG TPA: DUF6544 family protein [Gemmatimonadales bacterium]|nr:DUF6544 family protein [Gemmatimonadales bacterium]